MSLERFITATKTGEIHVWDFSNGALKTQVSLKGGETLIGLVSFSEDEQRVISLGDDGRLQLWDATVGMLIPNEVSH
jgi:WD40 repeat protein